MNKKLNLILIAFSGLLFLSYSCGSKSGSKGSLPPKQEPKISKAIFFIENSGSMFGYVKQANEFISTLVGLSYMPVFDTVPKSFYFINGITSNICIKFIGNDPECLKNKLNSTSFHVGNIQNSDLNKMFEIALDSAKNNNISAIISDCIYDVGNEINPLTALKIETQKTQQIFRKRIEKDKVETVIIKAYSKFTGDYCFGSKSGSIAINQIRPYYIVFIGKSTILNNRYRRLSLPIIYQYINVLARI